MNSNKILERRKKCFVAWTATIHQKGRTVLPNRFHEREQRQVSVAKDEFSDSFELEMAAWEQASDDDFEAFDASI